MIASLLCVAALSAFAPGEVTVRGEIGERMRLAADYIRSIDIEKTYVSHFRERQVEPKIWCGFAGWGMMLDAIVKAAAHGVGDEEFREFKDKWIAETLKCQAADGSISMWKDKVGMWDNHEQAYLIQAFCRDWMWFGNRASLEGARRLGDYIISKGIGVNLGLSSAFVYLYQATGDIRYADHLRDKYLVEKDNDAYNSILPVNGVEHVYTWLERAVSQLEYAAATGRRSATCEDSTRECFRWLFNGYASITGSVTGGIAWGEIWDDGEIGLGKWGETCASAYLMRLASEWMKVNPDPVLGDVYERIMYNAFFGAQNHNGTKYRYFIPFNEKGEWFERDTYCCPNNFRREIFEIPDFVFLRRGRGFVINLFAPATLKTKDLEVEMTTDYPKCGKVSISVKSSQAGEFAVRVPRWATIPDSGKWRKFEYAAGETKVEFEFPMAIRAIAGRRAQSGRVALMRGPVVYAFKPSKGEWGGNADTFTIDASKQLKWNGSGIEVSGIYNHLRRQKCKRVFVPFSDDGRQRTYFPMFGRELSPVADELFASGLEK